MRETDFTQYRERQVRRTDRCNTFNEALASVVQIAEAEGWDHPVVKITPCWVYGDDQDGELYFDLVIASHRYQDSGEEV